MATAPDSVDVSIKVIEDDLSCNICYNLLREPKDLDCPHVFCLQCLQKWAGAEPTVECPECRHVTIVPEGGLVNLKTNFRLKKVIGKYAEQSTYQKGVPICPSHDGEEQHEIQKLKAIVETKKSVVKAKMNDVYQKVKGTEVAEKKLCEMEQKLQRHREKAKQDVENRLKEVIIDAETKSKEMKDDIDAEYQQRVEMLKTEQHCAKDMLTQLHNVHTESQNTLDSAADHVFMKQHTALIDKMDKLCITELEMPSSDLATLQFNPGSGPANASWFGEVVVGGNRKCELKLIHEFGEFQQAQAVAVSQSGLLAVVDYGARAVIIYRDVNGENTEQFKLGSPSGDPDGKITEPYNIAVTSGGKFLVAHGGWIIKIFSSSGRYEKTLTDVGDTITTTPDDLIVTGNGTTGVITVHQSGGKLIRKHQVDCKHMSDIVSNGKHIAFTTDSKSNSIHVIELVTGQTVWTVDMIGARGICYEPATKSLLVAGGSTSVGQFVIEQYCSTTGHLISRVASGLCNPLSMTVTQDSKLIVADWKTVKILI